MDLGQKPSRKPDAPRLAQRVRHKRNQDLTLADRGRREQHPHGSLMRSLTKRRGKGGKK